MHPLRVRLAHQDDAARPVQDHRHAVAPGRQRHHQHGQQHHRGHLRAADRVDAGALVQGVPEIDREIDDGDVDAAHQHQNGAGTIGAVAVLDGVGQRQIAEVQEQQDQRRGHPGVPGPVGAPGGLAPQRACPQRDGGPQRPGGRQRGDHHRRHPGAEAQVQDGVDRHHQIDEHGHPGRRHVDEDDPVDLALLEVGGGLPEAQPQTHQAQQGGTHGKPGDQPAGQGIEALRGCVGKQVHAGYHSNEVRSASATR